MLGKYLNTEIIRSTLWLQRKKQKLSKKDGNNTQVFSYKTLLLHTSHVLLAVFQQPTVFFPNKIFASHLNTFHSKTKSPMTLDDLLQGTNYVNNNTLQLQFVVFSKRNVTSIVAFSSFSFLVWSHALVHQLTTPLNSCAHLRRDPAECPNASYCESSANKTSCMSSWCALLLESHRLCGKLFIFPAVSSLRTSVQLL